MLSLPTTCYLSIIRIFGLITAGKACTAACAKKFKSSCMAWVRNFGASCAQAYSNCRGKLNNGDPMLLREGCTKACKSTKTMLAYKSKC